MVTFSLPKESWWPVDLRCLLNGRSGLQKFSSTHTGEKIIIYCNANCKTENIIYLLEYVICGLQYIGETKQQLSKRFNGHRSDGNCKSDLPLSRHWRRPTKKGVKRGYYFFSLISFGDKVLSFLIQKLSLSCLLLSSHLGLKFEKSLYCFKILFN
jgi:hypothetical protein